MEYLFYNNLNTNLLQIIRAASINIVFCLLLGYYKNGLLTFRFQELGIFGFKHIVVSQSATLYRVSKEIFLQLETSEERGRFNIPAIAKSYSTFQGSFMGLEFVLSKGQNKKMADLIAEIFNPSKAMRMQGAQEMDQLKEEDILAMFESYESGENIYYLDSNTVSQINIFLKTQSAAQVIARYDSEELNENGIYPEVWTPGNSQDAAFNELDITEGLIELKKIFEAADLDQDSILVFVG